MTGTASRRDRAWRRAETRRIIANRLRLLRQYSSPLAVRYATCANRLGTRHPFDCGTTRCPLCSPWKAHAKGGQETRVARLEALLRREVWSWR